MELGKPKEGHISSVQPAAVAHFHSGERWNVLYEMLCIGSYENPNHFNVVNK